MEVSFIQGIVRPDVAREVWYRLVSLLLIVLFSILTSVLVWILNYL